MCPGNRAKGVAGKPFSKETRTVTHRFKQPSQQKSGIGAGYPGRICVKCSCLQEWLPLTSIGDSQGFWEHYTSRNTTSLDEKGQKWDERKEEPLQGQNSGPKDQRRQSCYPEGLRGQIIETQKIILSLTTERNLSWGFQNLPYTNNPFVYSIFSFRNRSVYFMPVLPLYFGNR